MSLYLPLLLWPRPLQFPPPRSGDVGDLPCVAFPWHSNAGGGSGPGELMYKRVSLSVSLCVCSHVAHH